MALPLEKSRVVRRVFYGWWLVAAGSVINALGHGFIWMGFTIFFLPVVRDLGMSRAALSLVYGFARLEGGIEGPVVGWLIDRFGPRWVMVAGVVMAGVGFILLATAPNYIAFFLIYVLIIGVGNNAGFLFPISTALNSWFIRRRGTAFGLVSSAGAVGGVVLVPLLAFMVLNLGWRTASMVAGLIILAVSIPLALPFHRSPESRGLHPDGLPPQGSGASAAAPGLAGADFSVGEAMRTVNYWLLAVTLSLRIGVTTAVVAHMVPILVWKGLDEATGAYMVGLFNLGFIATTLLLSWLGDRWSKTMVSALGAFAGLVGLVLLLNTQGLTSGYILAIGLALIMGTMPLNWVLIGDFFGRKRYATLRGTMGVVFSLSAFLSPVYAGWVYDRTMSYEEALVTFSVILGVVTVLFTLLRRPAPPRRG